MWPILPPQLSMLANSLSRPKSYGLHLTTFHRASSCLVPGTALSPTFASSGDRLKGAKATTPASHLHYPSA
jgi:hypothetical protein